MAGGIRTRHGYLARGPIQRVPCAVAVRMSCARLSVYVMCVERPSRPRGGPSHV